MKRIGNLFNRIISKDYLRYCLQETEKYLADNLKLKVKRNWQIFPVEARGYRFYWLCILPRSYFTQERYQKEVYS